MNEQDHIYCSGNGTIDEVVINDLDQCRVEQMDDGCSYWVTLRRGDAEFHLLFRGTGKAPVDILMRNDGFDALIPEPKPNDENMK